MNDMNKTLNNIMNVALEKAEGKDKQMLEEAMAVMANLNKIQEGEPSPRQKINKMMDEFTEKIQKIKDE